MGYSFRLTARVLLYAPSHRQDSTYHGLCYTSRGALAGMRNGNQQNCINIFSDSLRTGPDGTVVMSLANGLVGTGFASRYRHQPRAVGVRPNKCEVL